MALYGHLGETRRRIGQIDPLTHSQAYITVPHWKIHAGEMFHTFVIDSDFNNADIISIALQTPPGDLRLHAFAMGSATTFAQFDVLELPTITDGTGTDFTPRNHRRDITNISAVLNAMAAPTANRVRINPTITNDGFVLHSEMVGAGRTGAGVEGSRSEWEWVLAPDRVYAFRLTGNGVGPSNEIGSLCVNWYEDEHKDEVGP